MVTLHIMTGNTTRPAPTASCLRTPPCSLTASQRDGTSSSLVSFFRSSFLVSNISTTFCFLTTSPHPLVLLLLKHEPATWTQLSLRPSRGSPSVLTSSRSTTSRAKVSRLFTLHLNYQRNLFPCFFLHLSMIPFQIFVQMTEKPLLLRRRRKMKLLLSLQWSEANEERRSPTNSLLTFKETLLNIY